mgnify:CR=1 FL=1
MRTLGFALAISLLPLAACGGDKDGTTSTADTGPGTTTGDDDDDDDDDTSAFDGAQLYADNCAICHGANGEGAASAPATMNAYITGLSQAEIATQITDGGGSMPAITAVTADEADAIAAWCLETF